MHGRRAVQGDSAWPEYRFGELFALHFFSDFSVEYNPATQRSTVVRAYECYTRGKILTRLFCGTDESLGEEIGEQEVKKLGIAPETILPVDEIAAVHIPNIRPNRLYRGSYMGRSDSEGLRGLMDALDEAYSSWMRDIRLGKARLIVPVEFLKRKPSELIEGTCANSLFEFDEDVETLAALDINPDAREAAKITPTQFSIRAEEHQKTCTDLLVKIITCAGYSPQTFGLNIEGLAQSGTALHIREKKSLKTCVKKQSYWQDALECLLTTLVHLDAAFFPGKGSSDDVHVHVRFPDAFATDISTMASSMEMLDRAKAVSAHVKVRMLHPDWSEADLIAEEKRIQSEYGIAIDEPDAGLGDYAPRPEQGGEEGAEESALQAAQRETEGETGDD